MEDFQIVNLNRIQTRNDALFLGFILQQVIQCNFQQASTKNNSNTWDVFSHFTTEELIALVQGQLDVGDPQQVKEFDDAMGEKDEHERERKLFALLRADLSRLSALDSVRAQNTRLIEDLETAVLLLRRDSGAGSPGNQAWRAQVERLARRLPEIPDSKLDGYAEQFEKFSKLKVDIEHAEVDDLRNSCLELISMIELSAVINTHTMKKQEQLEDEVKALRVQETVNQDCIEALKTENEKLLKVNNDTLQQALADKDAEIAQLQVQLQRQQKKFEHLEKKIKAIERREIGVTTEMESKEDIHLKQRLTELENQLQAAQAETINAREALKSQIQSQEEKWQAKLANKRRQRIELATQNASLTVQLQEAEASRKTLQAQIESITEKHEETQRAIADLSASMTALGANYEAVCQMCETLKERYRESQEKRKILKDSLRQFQSAEGIAQLRAGYAEMKQKCDELTAQSQADKMKLKRLVEAAVKVVCQKFARAIGEVFEDRGCGDELEAEIDKLADRIRVINNRTTGPVKKTRERRIPLLPTMDELDREIENLKHNIAH